MKERRKKNILKPVRYFNPKIYRNNGNQKCGKKITWGRWNTIPRNIPVEDG